MSMVCCVLGAWLVGSVPLALAIGWMCKLNQLSDDGAEVSIASGPEPVRRGRFVLEPMNP